MNGGACSCGASCGEACTCGDGCTDGSALGGCTCGGRGACGCGKCGDGCQACGRRSPCWLANLFCRCTDCGEFYWNEWYNDPPRCAEPCDCNGNWIGGGWAGNYRAPYRSHHGWLFGKYERQKSSQEIAAAESEPIQDSAGSALGAAEPGGKQVDDEALETAVYDDAELAPELQ
jgi:hypothetical protein